MTNIATLIVRLSVCCLALSTILPVLPVGAWVVRLFDFPRVQIATLLLIAIVGIMVSARQTWSYEHFALLVICGVSLVWQLAHIVPYTPLWKPELAAVSAADEPMMTVAVINLQYENAEKQAVARQLSKRNSDILLLIEYDQRWREALGEIERDYPYTEGIVRGHGLGIMMWSKFPLVESETRHLVSSRRASVFAKVRTPTGELVNFVGLHPTPPGLEDPAEDSARYDSRIRDAELMIVAKLVAEAPKEKWIVTGDFNDVAWSHTTRLFRRVSGLKDARVGRGLYNTYHADYPLFRFPIDHVFLSPGTNIHTLERFRPIGSDHFAITTTFALGDASNEGPQPVGDDLKEANELVEDGSQDARDHDNLAGQE